MPARFVHVLRVTARPQFVQAKEGEAELRTSDIQVLRTGEFDYHGRRLSITADVLDEMVENFKGPGVLPVDYNHGSGMAFDPESGKAAGWIEKLFRKGKDELWCSVEWTDQGAAYIEAGEYRYTSAEFQIDATSTEEPFAKIGAVLHAVALCNQPFVEGMAPVMLAAGIEIPPFFRPALSPSPRRTAMNEARIREILGLSADIAVTEEHRNTALSKLDEQLTTSRAETAGIVAAAEATDAAGVVATLKAAPEAGKVIALGAGRVIVSKVEHERLTARAAKADELERTTDGKVLLTAAEHGKLVANAASGADASRKLFAKEVDDLIETGTRDGRYGANLHASLRDIGMRDVDEADAPALREKNLKQLRASIEAHAKGTISFTQAGQDGDPGQATEIGAFIQERETAHLAAKRTATEAISLAHRDAEAKFGKAAFERYQYGDAAVAA